MRVLLAMHQQSRLNMYHSRKRECGQRPGQDFPASSVGLHESSKEKSEWDVFVEVALSATGYEESVVFAGGR